MNMDELYLKSVLTTKIHVSINLIGKNLHEILKEKLTSQISNNCISEGYVSPQNINLISISAGTIESDNVVYVVVYECMICHPVEGMQFIANIKTITVAGIHAYIIDENGNIPITAFVSRDHNNINENFHSVKEDDLIIIKLIGIRYEIRDPTISVISTFMSIYEKRINENENENGNENGNGNEEEEENEDEGENEGKDEDEGENEDENDVMNIEV